MPDADRAATHDAARRLFTTPATSPIASWPFHSQYHRMPLLASDKDPTKLLPYTVSAGRGRGRHGLRERVGHARGAGRASAASGDDRDRRARRRALLQWTKVLQAALLAAGYAWAFRAHGGRKMFAVILEEAG